MNNKENIPPKQKEIVAVWECDGYEYVSYSDGTNGYGTSL